MIYKYKWTVKRGTIQNVKESVDVTPDQFLELARITRLNTFIDIKNLSRVNNVNRSAVLYIDCSETFLRVMTNDK